MFVTHFIEKNVMNSRRNPVDYDETFAQWGLGQSQPGSGELVRSQDLQPLLENSRNELDF